MGEPHGLHKKMSAQEIIAFIGNAEKRKQNVKVTF